MTTYANSKYKIFQLRALPAGLFGETYLIATGIDAGGGTYKCECFVLSKRPKPDLYQASFPLFVGDVTEELPEIDLDFLVEEGRRQGENRIFDRLGELAEQHNRPDLVALPVQLIECHARPFAGCWMRGAFHEQIREVANSTECASLKEYLGLVASIHHSRRPG